MGVVKLSTRVKKRYIESNDSGFQVKFFITEDSSKLSPAELDILFGEFADQIRKTVDVNGTVKEEICLGNNREVVQNNLENNDYSAVCIVSSGLDKAVGSIQYYDWCGVGSPQLWVSDICRITTGQKAVPSPVKILLNVLERYALDKGLREAYLVIEDKEPERSILPKVYEGYGYRRLKGDELCVRAEYIVMKKELIRTIGGKRKTRKNRKHRQRL